MGHSDMLLGSSGVVRLKSCGTPKALCRLPLYAAARLVIVLMTAMSDSTIHANPVNKAISQSHYCINVIIDKRLNHSLNITDGGRGYSLQLSDRLRYAFRDKTGRDLPQNLFVYGITQAPECANGNANSIYITLNYIGDGVGSPWSTRPWKVAWSLNANNVQYNAPPQILDIPAMIRTGTIVPNSISNTFQMALSRDMVERANSIVDYITQGTYHDL